MSLIVEHLCFDIGSKRLLDEVSFAVNPGEVVAVLGPNGAGKSTLLRVLAGEYRHFAGDLSLNGQRYENWGTHDIARMVGVLPQHTTLMFPFSVFEVVLMGRMPHATGRVRDREIAKAALERVDMSHHISSSFPSLSGGEKQRVQLARVLAQIWDAAEQPRYLLLDEPTSALDLAHQHHVLALAQSLAQEGVGVMAILHDLNLAAQYADRLVLLEQGRVKTQGSVEQALDPDILESLFGIAVDVVPHPSQSWPLVVAR
ncbi:heme ABC transporter ATP-binding protein [Neptunomonas marina]|uniref:Heme ABC transporter ATP-binding protein n=1 Tax=Neptunomonas marina TaxID=1815562 RepID=A0A437Q4Z8_9GAMM|nr:heme ABC transporter ATP-binding protein [Neptunomonas marina]RVU29569.1 heme ABC transporter ATP-binding protein [Neptunomonas marina]